MKTAKQLLVVLFVLVSYCVLPVKWAAAAPAAGDDGQAYDPTPEELIAAVNALRVANGLWTLDPHPALMQVAQWEAEAIANGAPGHVRPPGLTLGQWMISLGFALSGNIALDGYRSENWVGDTGMTIEEAIEYWLGDPPHTETMLSVNRSHIGAGIALSLDDYGNTQYFYVIETALQTKSGEQQYDALLLMTSMAETQAVTYADATQAAIALAMPQYIVPVSTAIANGEGYVVHEVAYGQSLWAIAAAYGVSVDQIKQRNHLSETSLWVGQELVIPLDLTSQLSSAGDQTPSPAASLTDYSSETAAPAPSQSLEGERSSFPPGAKAVLFVFVGLTMVGMLVLLLRYGQGVS